MTLPGSENREFEPLGKHSFLEGSCFVLSDAGSKLAFRSGIEASSEALSGPENSEESNTPSPPLEGRSRSEGNGPPVDCKPSWDARRKELRVGNVRVRRFKCAAINQETVLAVFEEEGWPARVDDPLPMVPEQDPKQRLRDTIKCLNRNHLQPLIRFRGDGTGEGICWEFIDDEALEPDK